MTYRSNITSWNLYIDRFCVVIEYIDYFFYLLVE